MQHKMSENIDFKRGCIQKHPLFFAVDFLQNPANEVELQ